MDEFKNDALEESDNYVRYPSGEWHPQESPEIEEEKNQKIREAFQILTQGVEMVHYEAVRKKGEKTKIKKIMWMDPDILRLCVDVQRPTIRERARGRIPFGIYMRDIAEVRKGYNSYGFSKSSDPPAEKETCLSLIGSERTVCIQLPSKFSRDWFAERFNLVILDVLTEDEQTIRAKRKRGVPPPSFYLDSSISSQMQSLLERGIQVIHHHPNGKMIKAFLIYDGNSDKLSVHPSETYIFGFAPASLAMDAKDISEVRPGSHSLGFVRTNSTDKITEVCQCLYLWYK